MKKKILFVWPPTPGGPQHIYKLLGRAMRSQLLEGYEISETYTIWWWIKSHFQRYDLIVSAIPFFFHPLRTKVFVFHFHGDHKAQRKLPSLGNKLLYLVDWNCRFAEKLVISSRYLPEKLGMRDRYKSKRVIIPNPIELPESQVARTQVSQPLRLLTVSSTKFYLKGKWIIDIATELTKIQDMDIERTIIAGWNDAIQQQLQQELSAITLPPRVTYRWLWWLREKELVDYYVQSDIFVYGTRLDTWGQTIVQAMSYGLPVILLPYDAWEYIYPDRLITENIAQRIAEIINTYSEESTFSISFSRDFDCNEIGTALLSLCDS